MTSTQLPILIVTIPLFSAIIINIVGLIDRRWCWAVAVAGLACSLSAAVYTLKAVVATGTIHYRLGGWPPPIGIEYVIDHLNALVLVVVVTVSLVAAVFSLRSVERELPGKESQYYTLHMLLSAGLLGITITGDAFNLFVMTEIAALTSYALIAIGRDRALLSGLNYLIVGTIGACFYLLGVGHLYMITGSLNMADIMQLIPPLFGTSALMVAFILMLVGVWTKMAFFPLHGWLPNAYTYAPSATGCLLAPLMTKVSVYVMIRIMFYIFSHDFSYATFAHSGVIVWMAVAAIVAGSLLALAQKDFKKMLCYLIVAEVGYMVGGAWLANRTGVTGAVLHILNDAMMTLCLFLVAGIILYKKKSSAIAGFKGLYSEMPVTMAAFTVGAFSMIGVPPTVGFFSKWYLIIGAMQAGRWEYVAALLFSSLINAILFFRIIEIAYYPETDPHHGHHAHTKIDEAPASMLVPLVAVAASLIVIGIYTGDIVTSIITFAIPAGL